MRILSPFMVIWRIVATFVLVFGYRFLIGLYGLVQAPFEGGMAVKQLESSDLAYAQAKFVFDGGTQGALFALTCFLIIVLWTSLVAVYIKRKKLATNPNN